MATLKKILFSLSILTGLLLFGCEIFKGDDGDDGKVYVSVDYTTNATSLHVDILDFIKGTPDSISTNKNYEAVTGSHGGSYSLRDWGYVWWTYSYDFTLSANKGEDGSIFWSDGEDGEDKYYELFFNYYGSVSVTSTSRNIKSESESIKSKEGREEEVKTNSPVEDSD